MTEEERKALLLARAEYLIQVLDSYLFQGFEQTDIQTMRDILDVDKPIET